MIRNEAMITLQNRNRKSIQDISEPVKFDWLNNLHDDDLPKLLYLKKKNADFKEKFKPYQYVCGRTYYDRVDNRNITVDSMDDYMIFKPKFVTTEAKPYTFEQMLWAMQHPVENDIQWPNVIVAEVNGIRRLYYWDDKLKDYYTYYGQSASIMELLKASKIYLN